MFWYLYHITATACPHVTIIQHPSIEYKQITETSGIVAHGDLLWIHNDSGDLARVFSYSLSNKSLKEHTISGINAKDWEDIAIDREHNRLFIADTGDNRESRKDSSIVSYTIDTQQTSTYPISYQTGSIDIEAIAWDPLSQNIVLLSKGRGGMVHLFSFSPDNPPTKPLQSIYKFPISPASGLNPERITAMDITQNGSLIAVRNYISLFLWEREPNTTISQTLSKKPCTYDLPVQKQGESIGFSDDGLSLWTLSEGKNQPLIELRLTRDNPTSLP